MIKPSQTFSRNEANEIYRTAILNKSSLKTAMLKAMEVYNSNGLSLNKIRGGFEVTSGSYETHKIVKGELEICYYGS